MLEAERRYFDAYALHMPDEVKRQIAQDVHKSRERYWDLTDKFEAGRN
jgi:hypothetical protein